MATSADAIDEFWEWVTAHLDELQPEALAAGGYHELDRRVVALGFAWEVGPADDGGCFLALSPSGTRERLVETRAAVARAPRVRGWQFLPAKPPRVVDLAVLDLMLEGGRRSFDITTWEVVAVRFPDGVSDLLFRPPATETADRDTLWQVASIVVDGELGEARRLDAVNVIEIVDTWEPRYAPHARPVRAGLLARMTA